MKLSKFVMPKAYPADLDAAITDNEMSPLEKARFVRYMASHVFAQQPNPTPTEYGIMAEQCVAICPCLADTPSTNHKVYIRVATLLM